MVMATDIKRGPVNPFTNQRTLSAAEVSTRAATRSAADQDEDDLIETVRQMVKESGLDAVRRHIESFKD
jgi:hypothetical protein